MRVNQEVCQEVQRIPDGFAVDHSTRRRDNDTNERCDCESKGNGEELRPQSILGLPCKTGEVRIVDLYCNRISKTILPKNVETARICEGVGDIVGL